MEFGKMDDFSLSDLAGSTAIIFASCGGLITVFLSSRCKIIYICIKHFIKIKIFTYFILNGN